MRKNLCEERKKCQYTQKEIAVLLGISERQYQNLEAGTSNGSVKTWQQLSRMFGRTIDYLLATKEEELFGEAPPNNSNHS